MMSSNGNIFRATGHLPHTLRPVTRGFDVFFDQRLNKRLYKQPWGYHTHYDVTVMSYKHHENEANAASATLWTQKTSPTSSPYTEYLLKYAHVFVVILGRKGILSLWLECPYW